ncbi:MAG: response regulator transcription factor [Verrucomicrobiota bacterium]|nr:response regulator transcription factor [Verrucomicrobiota bacterium]
MLPDLIKIGKTPIQPKAIRVAIVEDDAGVRAELAERIALNPSYSVVRSFPDAESALEDLPRSAPDVVLMDIHLPGMDGVECVRRLKGLMPRVHVIMLTVCEDGNRLFKSLSAGASGYLLKRSGSAQLLSAIREVCEGGAPMTPEIARRVIQRFRQISATEAAAVKLTPREQEILEQLSKGFRYKEIVENLGISFGTLHSYISKVYEKLHVHSRTEAVVKYLSF